MNLKTNYARISRIMIIIVMYSVIISPVYLFSDQVKSALNTYVFTNSVRSILGSYLPYIQYTLITLFALLILGVLIVIASKLFFSQTASEVKVLKLKNFEIKARAEDYLDFKEFSGGSILPGLMSRSNVKKALSGLYVLAAMLPILEGNYMITIMLISLPFIIFELSGILRSERRKTDFKLKVAVLLCFFVLFSSAAYITVKEIEGNKFQSNFASRVLCDIPDLLDKVHIKINPEVFYNSASKFGGTSALPLLKKGDLQEKRGNLQQAEYNYKMALSNDADSYEAYYRLGKLYITQKENIKAFDMLQKAQLVNPLFMPAFYEAAKLMLEDGDVDGAGNMLAAVTEIDGNDIEIYRLNARIMLAKRNYKDAISSYSKAIEISPKSADLFSEKAIVLFAARRLDEALYNINMALILKPGNEADSILKGLILAGQNNYSDAFTFFNKNKDVRVDSILAKGEQVRASLGNGDINTAKQEIEKGLDKAINDAGTHFINAYILCARSDYDGALKEIDEAILLDQNKPDYYGLKGEILLNRGETAKVNDQLQLAFALDEKNYYAYYIKGRYFLVLGNYQNASIAFDVAASLNSYSSRAFAGKAVAESLLSNSEKADDYLYTAAKLNPGDYFNYYAKSVIYFNKKRHAEALTALNKAIELNGKSVELDMQKAKIMGVNGVGTAIN